MDYVKALKCEGVKMKGLSALLLAGTLLCMPLYGCAQTQSETQSETQEDTQSETQEDTQSETQLDPKYDAIIADLEEGDYDGAIAAINEMKEEAQTEVYADMAEYLVTVELTPENFDEYFEWISLPVIDAFGERTDCMLGLRSKKYEEGLIIYGLNDQSYCDPLLIEYTYRNHGEVDQAGTAYQAKDSLDSLLSFDGGFSIVDDSITSVSVDSLDRIAGSKLTFIKEEFVESYNIDDTLNPIYDPDAYNVGSAEITLKNGETFWRYIVLNYPY